MKMEIVSDKTKENIASHAILWIAACVGSVALGIACFFWSIQTDFWIAKASGAIIEPPPPAWTTFSTPDRMFGSLLGPAMSVHPVLFLGGCLLAGLFPSVILLQSVRRKKLVLGRFAWLLLATVTLWLIKVPMPGNWTLYYQFEVRY